VCSALFAALPRISPSFSKKEVRTRGRKVKVNMVSKMGDIPVPGYETYWTNKLYTLKSEYQILVQQYPEADAKLAAPSGAG
jgi:hypothetical protein